MPTVEKPRLVIQITVDQLASSLIERQASKFEEGGFRRLMDQGAWFPNTRHAHAHTQTVVGHTTLATGTYPASHGMIGNEWYSRQDGQVIYSVGSEDRVVCGLTPENSTGASPTRILVDTFGDDLHQATDGKAKIFSVSGKDRSAVAMGGKTGTAFWYDPAAQGFVTSDAYLAACPDWVAAWQGAPETPTAARYLGQQWTLSRPESDYQFGPQNTYEMGTPAENNMAGLALDGQIFPFNRNFPHEYTEGGLYYQALTLTPGMDELISDFALEVIRNEELGKDDVTDYLAVNFSTNDAVLHLFGPSSRESEDILYRLDRTLAKLFAELDAQVGAENVLIVLSGDHGGGEYPVVSRAAGHDADWVKKGAVDDAVATALADNNWPAEIIAHLSMPYLHLDHAKLDEHKLDSRQVLTTLGQAIEAVKGIDRAVQTAELSAEPTEIEQLVYNNHNAERSGDLYVVLQTFWQQSQRADDDPNPFDSLQHGSPWDYDGDVPLGFSGPGVAAGLQSRDDVQSVDIVPTLAQFLGTEPGPEVSGKVLDGVLSTTSK